MTLEEIIKLADEFEALTQDPAVDTNQAPPAPSVPASSVNTEERAAKEQKNREMRETVRSIKTLADSIERKYTALKTIGFFKQTSTMRELRKVRSVLEDCNRSLDRLF
jgi:hypothetical protein